MRLSRLLIESGSFRLGQLGFHVQGGYFAYSPYAPIVASWDSDDLRLTDADGHVYDGSILRRVFLGEMMSSDPQLRLYQDALLDSVQAQLRESAMAELEVALRTGTLDQTLPDLWHNFDEMSYTPQ